MSTVIKADQRSNYETAYASFSEIYGMPDRKISDGKEFQGRRILTLGSGVAHDLWYLAERNEVVALDYATAGLEVAKRHGIKVVSGDLNTDPRLPFEDESFDVVVCKDILEHLLDPLAVLREAKRVLRRDGYIVVNVPNQFSFGMRLRILIGQGIVYQSLIESHRQDYDDWNYMHIRFFTHAGFRRFVKASGLKIEKWFWDFGALAHYHQPEMWFEPQQWKRSQGIPLSPLGKAGLYVLRPLWAAFNVVFPRRLRAFIVSIAPGLLSSGFYVHCKRADYC